MTLDLSEVKKIAEQCGACTFQENGELYPYKFSFGPKEMFAFAQAIYAMGAADQKEKDAKICEDYPKRDPGEDGNGYWAAENCAQAIRSQP